VKDEITDFDPKLMIVPPKLNSGSGIVSHRKCGVAPGLYGRFSSGRKTELEP
jgi:hypothetical protein